MPCPTPVRSRKSTAGKQGLEHVLPSAIRLHLLLTEEGISLWLWLQTALGLFGATQRSCPVLEPDGEQTARRLEGTVNASTRRFVT